MEPLHYFELRKATRSNGSFSADVMRHLHTRQHLGKAVIISDEPMSVLSSARKQWLKLSRSLQKQRSSTLNADKILKYTHAVTRMQRMHFSTKSPLERPEADIYFLKPESTLDVMPLHCWTVYILDPIGSKTALRVIGQLPSEALLVDYGHSLDWQVLGLYPKKMLEDQVTKQWRQVQDFLLAHQIDVTQLIVDGIHNVEAMDDALDTILGGYGHKFLQEANSFQRALELARPLRLSKKLRSTYDSLVLLAHRVQALTPNAFSQHFLEVYNEDDTFFLYDPARHLTATGLETIEQAFVRHKNAGRHHLARSIQAMAAAAPAPST